MDFSCALITGGGGRIGRALATWLIQKGKKVIIAGRTESNLRQTASEIGAAAYYVLDTGCVQDIPSFVAQVLSEHPDIDCLINNAGVQRPLDIIKGTPRDFLAKADEELNINIRGPMHLTLHFLDHFKPKKEGTCIINVSSLLGYIPFSVINPVYNGTKAWMHFWSTNLRSQLQQGGYNGIKIIEIAPPSVETDLHREREDPDDNKKEKNPNAMSLDEFMEDVTEKLQRGDDLIAPGMSGDAVHRWQVDFGHPYAEMTSH